MKSVIKYIYPNYKILSIFLLIDILTLLLSYKIFILPLTVLPFIFILIFFFFSAISATLQNPNLGILMAFALMPFERIGGFYYHSIHIRFDQLIIGIAVFVFLISALILKRFRIKKDPVFIVILILIAVNILSLINAVNMSREIEILLFTFITYIVYFLVPFNFFNIKYVKYIPYIIFSVTILLSIFGLFQYFGNLIFNLPGSVVGLSAPYVKDVLGYPRIQATEVEPLYYGTYLIFSITLALGYIITYIKEYGLLSKIKNLKDTMISKYLFILSIIAFLLGGINLILTYARGAWIGEILAIIVLLGFLAYIYNINKKIIVTIILAFVILVSMFFILQSVHKLPHFATKLAQRAENLSSPDRVFLDNNATQAFATHPILGIGVGGFGPYMSINPYVMPPALYGQFEGYGWAIVNNEYLEILAETGILGFITFISLIILILYKGVKASMMKNSKTDLDNKFLRITLVSSIAALVGILLQYLTFSTLYILQIWLVLMLVYLISYHIINESGSQGPKAKGSGSKESRHDTKS